MELSDGCIRNVYMQGWITMDHYEVYNEFRANVPERDLTELETALCRRMRKSLCGDRHAPGAVCRASTSCRRTRPAS